MGLLNIILLSYSQSSLLHFVGMYKSKGLMRHSSIPSVSLEYIAILTVSLAVKNDISDSLICRFMV